MTTLANFERKRQESMHKYCEIWPELIVTKGFSSFKVNLTANTPTLILRVDRPKAFAITNINNPDNTPVFIGPNQAVSIDSGFPIVAGDPLIFGVAENTEIWGIAVVDMILYILDMGL